MVWIDAFADSAVAREAHVRRRMARRRSHCIFRPVVERRPAEPSAPLGIFGAVVCLYDMLA